MAVAIAAPDVAEALAAACRAFRKAASDDLGGWHMASATAEVRPGETKPLILEHVIGKRPQATGS